MADQSFTKRQKERQRKEKQQAKAAKKADKKRDKELGIGPSDTELAPGEAPAAEFPI